MSRISPIKGKGAPKGSPSRKSCYNYQETATDRTETFKKMEHLYKLRSNFLHMGIDNVTEADIVLISYYAFQVMIKLISYSEKLNDIGKLIEKINNSKYGGPPF